MEAIITDQLLREAPKDDGYSSNSTKNDFVANGQIIVSVAKGIEENTLKTRDEQIREEVPQANVCMATLLPLSPSACNSALKSDGSRPSICVAAWRRT